MTPTPQQPPQDWRERFESLYRQYIEPFYEKGFDCDGILGKFIASEIEAARKEGMNEGMLKYDEMIEYHKDLREEAIAKARQEERQRLREEIEKRKKDGWNNFDKRDLNEFEEGYNQALDDLTVKLNEK